MKHKKRPVPFKLDPSAREPLVSQMVKGLRNAITSGYYEVGEYLPTWKELSDACNVSVRVPREAVSWLIDDGYLEARRHVGTRVLARGASHWKGHVLVIDLEGTELSYYSNVILAAIQQRLCNSGHFLSRITLPKTIDGDCDVRPLDAILKNRFDLAITHSSFQPILQKLNQSKTPYFIHAGRMPRGGCELATLHFDACSAAQEFVRQCVRTKTRSILIVGHTPDQFHIAAPAKAAHIRLHYLKVPFPKAAGSSFLHALIQESYNALDAYLNKGYRLPDLIYFTDDYVATGGFLALLERGIRIPNDVKAASLINTGFLPAYTKSVAGFEVNAFHFGNSVGDAVESHLNGKPIRPEIVYPVKYVSGETFPDVSRV